VRHLNQIKFAFRRDRLNLADLRSDAELLVKCAHCCVSVDPLGIPTCIREFADSCTKSTGDVEKAAFGPGGNEGRVDSKGSLCPNSTDPSASQPNSFFSPIIGDVPIPSPVAREKVEVRKEGGISVPARAA
jgi:hypothetical protein